ncbi:MAG TPA: chemotaxis protein CheW [Acetobacteraceae bacterium]|nr:chemotaxis protein CheW [Acetobacteraceae bacterium]
MTTNDCGQFVTLGLDHEVFAVPVELVREILDMRQPFRIPEAPVHLAGLIDVRGQAVPVIDLRLKLGLTPREAGSDTRILVLDVPLGQRFLTLGLIADRVFEVTALDPGSVGPPPDIGTAWHCDYIKGIGRRGDTFVVIFDLSRLLSSEDVALLHSVRPGAMPPALTEA